MATIKAKVWYKHIKEGDVILVQLKPGHIWHSLVKDDLIQVTVRTKFPDGTINGYFNHPAIYIQDCGINIGFEGTNWAEDYPANIIRKIKSPSN